MDAFPKDLMAKKVITIRDVDNILTARRLMLEKRIRHIPVVDAADTIVGILSAKDVTIATEFPHLRVEHVMSTPIEFVTENSSLKVAINKMLSQKISSLIVVDEKSECVGIFTSDDLLLYLYQKLEHEEKNKQKDPSWIETFKMTVGQVAHRLSDAGL